MIVGEGRKEVSGICERSKKLVLIPGKRRIRKMVQCKAVRTLLRGSQDTLFAYKKYRLDIVLNGKMQS